VCHDLAIARFEFHVSVERHARDVFEYLTDPAHLHEYDARIVEIAHEPPGPLTVGTRIREVRSILGRRVTQRLLVTELEEPVLLALRITEGPMPAEIRSVLEPQGAITRIHVSATSEMSGVARVAEPVMVRAAKRQIRAYFDRLCERLVASG
jgi:hypothetical protein